MPGFDKTGPMGKGSGTGRGLGVCRGARFHSDRFFGGYPVMKPPAYRRGASFLRGRRSGVEVRRRPEVY